MCQVVSFFLGCQLRCAFLQFFGVSALALERDDGKFVLDILLFQSSAFGNQQTGLDHLFFIVFW